MAKVLGVARDFRYIVVIIWQDLGFLSLYMSLIVEAIITALYYIYDWIWLDLALYGDVVAVIVIFIA